MPTVHDIIKEQDELAAHSPPITMWPKKWKSYPNPRVLSWKLVRLVNASRNSVPFKSGIYSLLIRPDIAAHPSCSYLMYIGQTVDLRTRFGNYLTSERKETGRAKLFRLLNRYDEYLWFCFCEVPEADLDTVEDALIEAYVPHANGDFPADMRPVVRAFR